METNVITIEKGIPIPEYTWHGNSTKYKFIKNMDIGDSFYINGTTPDFSPVSVKAHVYKLNADTERKYTIRTIEGKSKNPISIRVWRTK
tara:strand:- start:1028 stop:1294 length:267 start_codon:yes stop_codon:yes gene_type:complete